jgi:prepilin-type N-terminal cleavage/methylation domain-containing protein
MRSQLISVVLGRKKRQDGFTLVELLVVIGIIAILAGVALGPITSGIKKAAQSSGVQTSRTLAVAEFQYANDNNSTYPDGSGNASVIAQKLLTGNYVSDPGLFFINGSSETKYTGTSAATSIAQVNISWDFGGNSGSGINSNFPDQYPVVWSTVGTAAAPTLTGSGAIPITLTTTMPFGTAGIAVTYKSNSAKFISSTVSGTTYSSNITDATYPGGVTNASVLSGGG